MIDCIPWDRSLSSYHQQVEANRLIVVLIQVSHQTRLQVVIKKCRLFHRLKEWRYLLQCLFESCDMIEAGLILGASRWSTRSRKSMNSTKSFGPLCQRSPSISKGPQGQIDMWGQTVLWIPNSQRGKKDPWGAKDPRGPEKNPWDLKDKFDLVRASNQ